MPEIVMQPRQSLIFTTEATEILYGGAAGGGKSYAMRGLAISACLAVPGLKAYLFRREYKDLVLNHLEGPMSLPEMLAGVPAKFHQTDLAVYFDNGSILRLCHCQHEKDKYGYQGAEIHLLLIDELTLFTESIYNFLRSRVRIAGLDIPDCFLKGRLPLVVSASNPGNIGHTWVKSAFIDPAPAMTIHRAPKREGGMLRQYIPAKLSDNQILMKSDPEYVDRLYGLGDEALVRAMLDGDWDVVAGTMFGTAFKRQSHVIPRINIKANMPVWRAMDWGSARPYCVLWFTVTEGISGIPDGSLVVFHELYGVRYGELGVKANEGVQKTPDEVAEDIFSVEEALGIQALGGWADPAIWTKHAQEGRKFESVGSLFRRAGVFWKKAINDRINGWQVVLRYLKGNKEKNTPDLYITENCLHLIRTLPTLPRNPVKPDDIDTHAEDHAADALRYGMTPRIKPEIMMTPDLEPEFLSGERVIDLHDWAMGRV